MLKIKKGIIVNVIQMKYVNKQINSKFVTYIYKKKVKKKDFPLFENLRLFLL